MINTRHGETLGNGLQNLLFKGVVSCKLFTVPHIACVRIVSNELQAGIHGIAPFGLGDLGEVDETVTKFAVLLESQIVVHSLEIHAL